MPGDPIALPAFVGSRLCVRAKFRNRRARPAAGTKSAVGNGPFTMIGKSPHCMRRRRPLPRRRCAVWRYTLVFA